MNKSSNNINNNPIGFFDSGVGGITVFDELKKLLPNENYIYFGDTKNMPYGEKTKTQLLEYADNIFKFLESKQAKAVIMACNTTSAVVYDTLKDNYNFEVYPIIQSVAKQLSTLPIKRIGVFATNATINTHCYKKEIQKYTPNMEVIEIACPGWVKIVENGQEKSIEADIAVKEKMEEMLKFKPERIVLGCTHYPYLLNVLSKYAPRENFINPSIEFAKIIKKDLEDKSLLNNTSCEKTEEFYVSKAPENFKKSASMFYEIKSTPHLALN